MNTCAVLVRKRIVVCTSWFECILSLILSCRWRLAAMCLLSLKTTMSYVCCSVNIVTSVQFCFECDYFRRNRVQLLANNVCFESYARTKTNCRVYELVRVNTKSYPIVSLNVGDLPLCVCCRYIQTTDVCCSVNIVISVQFCFECDYFRRNRVQ